MSGVVFAIAVGNISEGVTMHGIFETFENALDCAKYIEGTSWHIVRIYPPKDWWKTAMNRNWSKEDEND